MQSEPSRIPLESCAPAPPKPCGDVYNGKAEVSDARVAEFSDQSVRGLALAIPDI